MRFCPQVLVHLAEWRANRSAIATDVIARFAPTRLAVRSSAANEDGWDQSMAGAYESRAHVPAEEGALVEAVEAVIESYGAAQDRDQILIQPMVADVALAGVVLTRDIETGGPYYVVNYDDMSGRTDTVTSGGAESKTVLVHRGRLQAIHSPRIRAIIDTVRKIEHATGCDRLDVEFCMTHAHDLFVLQVRPLAASRQWPPAIDDLVIPALAEIRSQIVAVMRPDPDLAGGTTILGEMSDWNPAEMIGNAPHPLALSLYKSLITDDCWWRARANMGYRAVPRSLLVALHGRPYIDVRLSLNSFLPASLPVASAHRLIDAQLARLAAHPELHDKIEFEIALTCSDLAFRRHAARLRDDGVAAADIEILEQHLTRLTIRFLSAGNGSIDRLLSRTRTLDGRGSLAAVLDACRRDGTVPFAELARHAFIGMAFLKSLVTRDALIPERADQFMRSIHTVAADFVRDLHAVSVKSRAREDFLARYGHLRPGTYDIMSMRYDENPDLYLGHHAHAPEPTSPFALTVAETAAIAELLEESGYSITPAALLHYIATAVTAREEAKFNFTRNVSNALSLITLWGERLGFGRDDLSFVKIGDILDDPDRGRLRECVAAGRETFRLTEIIRLPHLMTEPDDIDVVRLPLGRPTFITSQSVTAPLVQLGPNLAGRIGERIVLIESADPGYDWIFSHKIVGLVTKYGGANSHMAIRCAEFGLPAAIGCGERLYATIAAGKVIELNCAASTIKTLDSLQ